MEVRKGGLAQRGDEILSRLKSEFVIGVEVGVNLGQLSGYILERHSGLTLAMVDNWAPSDVQPERYRETGDLRAFDDAAECAKRETAARRVERRYGDRALILKMTSIEASRLFDDGSLDFVFLDADHSYEGLREDITAWSAKVAPGGWLCGHDYRSDYKEADFSGVDRAVDEWASRSGKTIEPGRNTTWFAQI